MELLNALSWIFGISACVGLVVALAGGTVHRLSRRDAIDSDVTQPVGTARVEDLDQPTRAIYGRDFT